MEQHQKELTNSGQNKDDDIEIDLIDLFYFFRSRWIIILVGFVVGALMAGLITMYLITPKFTATSKVYMVSPSKDSVVDLTDLNIGTSLSTDYEELLKTRPILEQVIKENKLNYTYEQMLTMVSIKTITDTRILTITAESTVPQESQDIANALANKAEKELPKLMDTSKPNVAEQAIYPEQKSSPSLSKNTMIGAALGMFLILAILTVMYMTDDTLKSAEDVEKAFGILPLSIIPEGDVKTISDKKEEEIQKEKKKRRRKKA